MNTHRPPGSSRDTLTRRDALRLLGAAGVIAAVRPARCQIASSGPSPILTRPIPSSGERLPLVGLGSWVTFNVGDDIPARDSCAEVMRAFFRRGGRLIDSSPMYGSSQETIGYALKKLGQAPPLFAADKVWTSAGEEGSAKQIEESRRHWGVRRFDLLQVHNLVSWEEHLPRLFAMKASGRLRYVGVTTSEGRRHAEIERILRTRPIDFVQVTYNVLDREVERSILPLARERGIGVIVNRPFRRGELIQRVARSPLPPWAAEIDCTSWAQVLLKFIVSHPAVTCAIPATSRVDHVLENVGASYGRLPDEAFRGRIVSHIERL
jgi:diketogulonate reductase-like aldo/keto reductase